MAERLRDCALLRFIRAPEKSLEVFTLIDWMVLLRTARRANLLSHMACVAARMKILDRLPVRVRFHFASALRVAESNQRSVFWEVRQISKALAAHDIPFVLLKGAAYIVGGFAPAPGRLLSDIDIMVHRKSLDEAEKAFFQNGWMTTKINNYDQRYYRTWMHELPPMQHLGRGTSLDVHHTILPPTALLKPDIKLLWADVRPLPAIRGAFVLGPADMVLHSATHLFHDGEFENGLRDLVDIDALLREFSQSDGFWPALVARAIELDLIRPLYYALKHASGLLDTPVPQQTMAAIAQAGRPGKVVSLLMDSLVSRSIGVVIQGEKSFLNGLALFLMFVRSHYLRMPLYLLIPHLLRKQFLSEN